MSKHFKNHAISQIQNTQRNDYIFYKYKTTGWWFQLIWKIWVRLDIFPKYSKGKQW